MTYYGDYAASTTVYMVFDTFAAATGAPTATTNFAAADIQIYKNAGTTQRASANGITVTTSFDSLTGLQMVAIDLSDDTTAGFYAAGNEYQVAVSDITADAQTLRFWLGTFSIERSGAALALLKAGTAKCTLADGVAHGGTLGSSTATLALSRLNITSQTSNTVAATITGNGTGSGVVATSGAGATGDGIQATSGATNGNGFVATGVGTGNGLKAVSVSGDAILAVAATSGHGITATGAGTTKHGINATGGATTSHGISATGGGVGHGILATSGGGATGDAIKGVAASTNGNGLNLVGVGTGNGMLTTGGAGAGGDGLDAVAGGGVDVRGNITGTITGNLVGTVSTLTTYTGNTVQTGDSFARLGAPAGASVSADIAAAKADTAAVKVQTDKLTFTVANQVDSNVLDWKSATAPAMTGDAFARLGAPAGASVSADVAAVKVDSAAVKVQTDKLAFTVTNQVDSNVLDWKSATAPAMTGDAYARIGANGAGLTSIAVGTGGIAAASFAAGAIDAAAIAADAIASSELAATAVTKIWANACTEPTAVVAASPTAIAALSWVVTMSRNQIEQTATTQTLRADDATTAIATAAVSEAAGTFTKGEFA